MTRRVLVTGGAGYVGSLLVPRLLARGHAVTVLDRLWYGAGALDPVRAEPGLRLLAADIRDRDAVRAALSGADAVVHLACISNDPSFELDPSLGRAINLDAFQPLVEESLRAGVSRFIYASSSSVYGVSDRAQVDEDHPLCPLTDYSRFKAECESILLQERRGGFCPIVVRPATLCGVAPRQRLDLTVNILTHHAFERGRITVFGGSQMRPNLHIEDMVDVYERLLAEPSERVSGRVYNVGYENHSVAELARIVREVVTAQRPEPAVDVETTDSADLRSYHISSRRIRAELGFLPRRTIADAVRDLYAAFAQGRLRGAAEDARYFNVRRMQELIRAGEAA